MRQSGQIVVVGAGIAGVAAARAAAAAGAQVIVLDEQDAPGGWLRSSLDELSGPPDFIEGKRGFQIAIELGELLSADGIDFRPGSVAWGLFDDRVLGVVGPDGSYQLAAEAVIVATGSTAIAWPFAGWTLPGVMTSGAARRFMHLHRVLPGRRAAVVGKGQDADRIVEDLELAGADVVARESSPDGLVARGSMAVEAIEVRGRETEVDAVVLAFGCLPDPELARHAGAELEFSAADGCHVPVLDRTMQTSVEGIYVVGDAAGIVAASVAHAQGTVAGIAAAGGDGLDGALAALESVTVERPPEVPFADPALIPDDVQVDREEQVTAGRIREAIGQGAVSINDVKRRTRAGMGVSQGRDTEYVIARMIQQQAGIALDRLLPMTARPPARLVSLADLAAIAVATD